MTAWEDWTCISLADTHDARSRSLCFAFLHPKLDTKAEFSRQETVGSLETPVEALSRGLLFLLNTTFSLKHQHTIGNLIMTKSHRKTYLLGRHDPKQGEH